MRIGLPSRLAQQIAWSAAREARSFASSRGWKSGSDIYPLWKDGQVSLRARTTYLMFQERGTKAHLMKELEGKLVPIDGRVVRVKDVGKSGFVNIRGAKIWRAEKWKHPGIKATHFMENSIKSALKYSKPAILDYMTQIVGGQGNGEV